MAFVEYDLMFRLLSRAAEISAEPSMNAGVVSVYNGVLKPAADAFQKAHYDVADAAGANGKESREAGEAFAGLDAHYKVARSVVLAFVPEAVLPKTLGALKTDTDKLNAIERLLDVLNDHAGEAWADQILSGDFGTLGAQAVKELDESIAANKALAKARDVRAEALGPAYEKFIAWKRVVRAALGSTSKQYKRIHVRSGPFVDDDKTEKEGPEPPAPAVAPLPS